jgi:hypothetical protein
VNKLKKFVTWKTRLDKVLTYEEAVADAKRRVSDAPTNFSKVYVLEIVDVAERAEPPVTITPYYGTGDAE